MTEHDSSVATDSFTPNPDDRPRSGLSGVSGRWKTEGELASGSRIGRYVVLYRLGRGGMGVVYAAYDPQLDRKVAVKLLRARKRPLSSGESHGRMLREAQALARLAHPNVVAVHDAGIFDDQVFVAMDFVEGDTLRRWLKVKPRSRPEIVAAYLQCGEALAAAHAAEIVHRDFKPDNAIIGRDGRVQVLDFGLARLQADTAADEVRLGHETGRETSSGGHRLPDPVLDPVRDKSREGKRRQGTPAYMAPEQHERGRVGPAADQFALCVSLWEALCERPPFAGKDDALVENIKEGRLTEPPRGRLTSRLRKILRRGLAADPKARYPSMRALLHDLRRDPRRRWRRVGLVAGTAVLAVGSAAAYQHFAADPGPCEASVERIGKVWNEAQQGRITTALGGVSRAHASHTAAAVVRALDDYAARWTEAHTDACAATHLRYEQSEALLDLRMACLSDRLDELSAVTELLGKADAEVADRALTTVDGLPSIERCQDALALRDRQPLPRDPARRREVEIARARVAHAEALERAGKVAEATTSARAALRRARELEFRPLMAKAGLVLGTALETRGEVAEARTVLLDAEIDAEIARDDATLSQIRITLVAVEGDRLGHPEQGQTWARLARATLERLGGDAGLEALLENNIALVLEHETRPEDVLAHQRRAVELAEQAELSELRLAPLYNNLAGTLAQMGQFDEALQRAQQARLTWERSLGAGHHKVAVAMATLGYIHDLQGDTRQALDWYQRGYDQIVRELGADNQHTADILGNLAIAQATLGRLDQAESSFRRVLALRRHAYGSDHAEVARAHGNLGVLLSRRGRFEEALAEQRRAVAIKERVLGPHALPVGVSLDEVANALEKLGRHAEALPLRERALEIREQVVGSSHASLTTPVANLAHNHLDVGQLDEALTLAERALVLSDDPAVLPIERAFVRLVLAKVLSLRGSAPDRVRSLFDAAQPALADQEAPTEREILAELSQRHGWEVVAAPPPSATDATSP